MFYQYREIGIFECNPPEQTLKIERSERPMVVRKTDIFQVAKE